MWTQYYGQYLLRPSLNQPADLQHGSSDQGDATRWAVASMEKEARGQDAGLQKGDNEERGA